MSNISQQGETYFNVQLIGSIYLFCNISRNAILMQAWGHGLKITKTEKVYLPKPLHQLDYLDTGAFSISGQRLWNILPTDTLAISDSNNFNQ
jgi:hypothetical protein